MFDDTVRKKVFLFDSTHNKTMLLYDFSKNVGDTVYMENLFSKDTMILDSIIVKNINSTNRRCFYFHRNNSPHPFIFEYIEGIGSTIDLLSPSIMVPDPYWKLTCNSFNGVNKYGNGNCDTIYIGTGINNQYIENLINVSSQEHTIFIDNKTKETIQFNVYDIVGNCILSKKINENHSSLEINNLSTSVYFYKAITEKNKIATGKILLK